MPMRDGKSLNFGVWVAPDGRGILQTDGEGQAANAPRGLPFYCSVMGGGGGILRLLL